MNTQTLVMGGGCFWCTEAVFEQLAGVADVTSGYAGGSPDTASYEAVCSGETNHAEAIRITFDADTITHDTLLNIFFDIAHDPTQKDRQGNDVGRQYRSVIFYADTAEKELAAAAIQGFEKASQKKAVTSLEPLEAFFPAEKYHQNFARAHPVQPYIFCIAKPKVDKLRKKYPQLVLDN